MISFLFFCIFSFSKKHPQTTAIQAKCELLFLLHPVPCFFP